MPRAPSNEIPYNMPWGKRSEPQLAHTPRVAQPQGRSSKGAAIGAVILTFFILVALYYQHLNSLYPGPASSPSQTVSSLRAGAREGNPPMITAVHFPQEIPADGKRIVGKVYFYDPDGDVVYVKFEPIAGRFTPFEFNPDVEGRTSGFLSFYIFCSSVNQVTLKVTLFDRQGHSSSPFYLRFRCVAPS
jgi:hypothetical protein